MMRFLVLNLLSLCLLSGATSFANDVCPATVIAGLPYTDVSSTAGLTQDYPSIGCSGLFGPDRIYQLTAAESSVHTISLCGSAYDTGLSLRTDGACPGATELVCNDDFCGVGSQIVSVLTAGTTYWIIVNGWNGNSGDYTLNVSSQAAINDCPGHVIPSLPFSDAGNTCVETNDFTNCVGSTSPDTVYSFTPAQGGLFTASLCGSSYDTGLEVRYGGNCPGDNALGCNDDNGPACEGLSSSIQFSATAGVPYYIIVHGFGAGCGDYAFSIDVPPEVGRCCYNDGHSCTDGISQTECESVLFGEFTPFVDCSQLCECAPVSNLVVGPGSANGTPLRWITASAGTDQVWSSIYYNNDGNPDGGLDTMWTLRASLPAAPGQNQWTETDFTPRYRNYVIVHVCP